MGLAKAAILLAKSSDEIAGVAKSLKSVVKGAGNLSVGKSLLKTLDLGSFASAFKVTVKGIKSSSNVIDVSKKVAKFAGALPRSADDILGSVIKNVDNVGDVSSGLVKNADTFGDSLDALKDVSKLENLKTLNKMQSVSDSLTSISKTTKKIDGVPRRLDNVADAVTSSGDKLKSIAKSLPDAKSADEIAEALKNSKGVLKKLDDVDGVASVGKKLDDVSDLATGAKKASKFSKSVETLGTLAQGGILIGFFLGSYLKNKNNGDFDPDAPVYDPLILVTDPASNIYAVALYEDQRPSATTSFEDILKTKEFIIAGIVVSIFMMV